MSDPLNLQDAVASLVGDYCVDLSKPISRKRREEIWQAEFPGERIILYKGSDSKIPSLILGRSTLYSEDSGEPIPGVLEFHPDRGVGSFTYEGVRQESVGALGQLIEGEKSYSQLLRESKGPDFFFEDKIDMSPAQKSRILELFEGYSLFDEAKGHELSPEMLQAINYLRDVYGGSEGAFALRQLSNLAVAGQLLDLKSKNQGFQNQLEAWFTENLPRVRSYLKLDEHQMAGIEHLKCWFDSTDQSATIFRMGNSGGHYSLFLRGEKDGGIRVYDPSYGPTPLYERVLPTDLDEMMGSVLFFGKHADSFLDWKLKSKSRYQPSVFFSEGGQGEQPLSTSLKDFKAYLKHQAKRGVSGLHPGRALKPAFQVTQNDSVNCGVYCLLMSDLLSSYGPKVRDDFVDFKV